jgi:hypothetical protein
MTSQYHNGMHTIKIFSSYFFGFYIDGVCKIVTEENLHFHSPLHLALQHDNGPKIVCSEESVMDSFCFVFKNVV